MTCMEKRKKYKVYFVFFNTLTVLFMDEVFHLVTENESVVGKI